MMEQYLGEQMSAVAFRDCRGTVPHPELVVDVLEMSLDACLAYEQCSGGLAIVRAIGDQLKHLLLAVRATNASSRFWNGALRALDELRGELLWRVRARLTKSASSLVAVTRPSEMTAIRSQCRSASSKKWVTNRIGTPVSRTRSTKPQVSLRT